MSSKNGFVPVFIREWNRIFRSKICIWGLIIAPIFSCCLLLYLMKDGLPHLTPVAVVDLDNTPISRALVRQLDAFPRTDIVYKDLSFREARISMEQGKVFGIFMIPKNFTQDAVSGDRPKLVFYTNNAFYITGSLLFQDMKKVAILASSAVGLRVGESYGLSRRDLMPVIQPIIIQANPLNNPWLNYSIYLNNIIIPGILFLVTMMFTVSSIGSEVKKGDGRFILDLSGNSIFKLLAGKLLPYTTIAVLLSLLFMSLFYCFNNFPLNSGFLPTFLNYLCLILSAQGLGMILLGLFVNYRFSLSIASLMGMISFSITGFSFSNLAMDPILQGVATLFPLRRFFLIYVDQALNGLPIGYSAMNYAILLVFFLIGLLFYKRIEGFLYENEYEE